MTANIKYPNDSVKQAAFENACDYLYYGYGRKRWMYNGHNCGLSDEESNKVWHEAFVYMSNQN